MLPRSRSNGLSGCWSLASHLWKSPAWGQRRQRCGPPLFPEQHARTRKRKRIDEGMRRRQRAPPQQTPRQLPEAIPRAPSRTS